MYRQHKNEYAYVITESVCRTQRLTWNGRMNYMPIHTTGMANWHRTKHAPASLMKRCAGTELATTICGEGCRRFPVALQHTHKKRFAMKHVQARPQKAYAVASSDAYMNAIWNVYLYRWAKFVCFCV